MGTWSVDAFGNDDAADWAFELAESTDLSLIEEALDTAIAASDDYLEAPDGAIALAAIEVIARLNGRWGERTVYTESVDSWVQRLGVKPTPPLISKAHTVIDLILADNSELPELWQEAEEYQAWLVSVQDLRSRLTEAVV